MVSAHNMMISTVNVAKPMATHSYTPSEHSVDCEAGPWSACSSTDLCTPMPHITSHPISSKRFSNASDRSLMSAPQSSVASSDVESVDYNFSKALHPFTPPTLLGPGSHIPGMMPPDAHRHAALYADVQNWSSGKVQTPPIDNSHDTPSSTCAFNSWCPEPISRAPFDGYYSAYTPPTHGAVDHSRTASFHSIASSTDSSSSLNLCEPDQPASRAMGNAPLLQTNSLDSFTRVLPGMSMPSVMRGGGLKQSSLMATQASLKAFNLHSASQEARSILDSLAPTPPVYVNSQLNAGSTPLMDSQTLLAYNAAFGSSPLLYLYGLTPELLAARSNALAQLVNASASGLPAVSASPIADDGSSLTNKKTNLYKTELCRSWEEKGTCRYGSKCQFAHGQDELKNVNRHPKFKTEVCRTFWLHGCCPYGKRCCFLHTTAAEGGKLPASDAHDKGALPSSCNAHDPSTSRLQKRVSGNLLSATSPSEKSCATSSASPQRQPSLVTRSLSDMSHSRSNSNSSCSSGSDGSSHIDSLRIHIWPRFGARDQVPPQDAPGPRSRLQRLRPPENYSDAPKSLPSTSTLATTRYTSSGDGHQPPHSALDISSILPRSPSQPVAKPYSASNAAESHWPLSRLPSSANSKA